MVTRLNNIKNLTNILQLLRGNAYNLCLLFYGNVDKLYK